MNEITLEQVKSGIQSGIICFVVDPNMESGTVCKIGDFWFYFGGMTAEDESPEEYLRHVPEDDVAREVYDTLEDFKQSFPEEYLYYYHELKKLGR